MTTTKPSLEQDVQTIAEPVQEQNSAAPQEEYTVGPGRPPREYQFQPGQSGNPKGAKRKAPTLAPDLKKLLEQALDKKVTITEGEKRRTLTLFAAGIEQFVRQYVKGDHRARKELFALAPQVGLDLLGLQKKALEEALPAHHQAMLYEYVEKQYDLVAQRPPVLAPPALLDDDNEGQS